MFSRIRNLTFVMLILALALTACAGNAPAPVTQNAVPTAKTVSSAAPTAQPAVNNGEGGTGGGEGGVEAALVTYADAAQGFAIGHPGPWTQDTSAKTGVTFMGGDDSMTLEFVTPAAKTDAAAYAQQDVAAVQAAFPGYKQLSLAPSTEVANAVILGFEANGVSKVTGKAFTAHNERYYMPLADGRIAVLTVAGPANHYDREGVRDIALTFKVTK
jgi:hypothetical protein